MSALPASATAAFPATNPFAAAFASLRARAPELRAADVAARRLTQLEGKSPAIVDDTADLRDTAEKLVWGKFLNAGQTCMAPRLPVGAGQRARPAGGAAINETILQLAYPSLPFGGVGNSGLGKAHGYAGLLAFSNEKAVLRQRIGLTNLTAFYPPYTSRATRLLGLLLKYL